MFALLAPVEVRHESPAAPAEERRIHRAIGIALNVARTVAIAALAFAALAFGVVGLRVVLYALGHPDVPFFRDVLAGLGIGQ